MRSGRRARPGKPGNALLEFVLTIPIIVFMAGVTMYMSLAMLARQQALVAARHELWHQTNNNSWSPMRLEDWASGGGAANANMPRGSGEELDRLRPEVEPSTIAKTTNGRARDYWQRIWDNLPARHHTKASRSFESKGSLWNFIDHTASAEHLRDSSTWHFHHIDAWRIARSGPLQVIFQAFQDNLQGSVAEHFKPTRDDILRRWWHGDDILDDEVQSAAQGGG